MSLNEDADNDMEIQSKITVCLDYKFEIFKGFSKIFYIFFLTFKVILIICRSAYFLDNKVSLLKITPWNATVTMENFSNVIIFFLALYNRFVNNKEVKRLKYSKNNLIFYFMIIPTLVLSVIYIIMVFEKIIQLSYIQNSYRSTLFFFTVLFDIAGIIIITMDVESTDRSIHQERSKNIELFHRFLINLAICETIHLFTFNLSDNYNMVFRDNIKKYKNISFPIVTTNQTDIDIVLHKFGWVIGCAYPALVIIILICLLTHNSEENKNFINNTDQQNIPMDFNNKPILLTAVIIIMGLFPMTILFYFKSEDSSSGKYLAINIFLCLGIFSYLVGIITCRIQLNDLKNWKKFKNKTFTYNLTDRTFVWIGFIGQMFSSFAYILLSIIRLMTLTNKSILFLTSYILYLFFHIFETIQSYNQTLLLDMSINKKWIKSKKGNSYAYIYCPILLLIGINFDAFFMCIYKNYVSSDTYLTTLSSDVLFKYSSAIGDIFSNIQRLHAVLFFIRMFRAIYLY